MADLDGNKTIRKPKLGRIRSDKQYDATASKQMLAVRSDNEDQTTCEEQMLAVRRSDNQDQSTGDEQTLAVRRSDNQGQTIDIVQFASHQELQHINVPGTGNIPIINPTGCTINIQHQYAAPSEECSTPERRDTPDQVAADSCEGELKAHYKSTGSYVLMIPWADEDKKHIMNIYTNLQLEMAGTSGRLLASFESIFLLKTFGGELINIAVLSGLAGRGKSTLFDKVACDWAVGSSPALKKYKLVLLLKMHALEQSSDLIDAVFDQLLAEDTDVEKCALETFIKRNSGKVLILLDGFDEFMTTSLCQSSFGSILKILNRKVCRGCTVLVTTRPSHFHKLVTRQLLQEPFTHVSVLGFDKIDIGEYVDKFYSNEHDKARGLLKRINHSKVLSNLAESPMLLLLMCLLWREDSTLPETISRLYNDAVKYIFKRKTDMSQEEISKVVIEIGKVALHGLLSPDQVLSFKERDFEASVLNMALKVGILTSKRVPKGLDTHNSVQFIHRTFQEFCAASYMQSLFVGDMQEFQKTLDGIMSNGPHGFEYLLRFCSGDSLSCRDAILMVLQDSQKNLSVNSRVGQLALHCLFECQSKCLPPKEFTDSFASEDIVIDHVDSDFLNSFTYFLKLADQTKDGDSANLSKVKKLCVSGCDLQRCGDLVSSMNLMTNLHYVELKDCPGIERAIRTIGLSLGGLPNLVELNLNYNCLGGAAAFNWIYLKQFQHLQKLNLSNCSVQGQNISGIANGLLNLVDLNLSWNIGLGVLKSHLKNLRSLQKLDLGWCCLGGQDVKCVSEALPNLVDLDLSGNNRLGGTVAFSLNSSQLLQKLGLRYCSLSGQDIKHVAETLPNLVELDLSNNWLCGTAVFWCVHLKQLPLLQKLILSGCSLAGQDIKHVAGALPNLVELDLSNLWMCGRAVSWSMHLNQLHHLENLVLSRCFLKGMDIQHVAEALPNLAAIDLSCNRLGTAVVWSKHLNQFQHLQKLDLTDCSLTAKDIGHIAQALPDVIELNLNLNYLSGTVALWSIHLKHLTHLKKLYLSKYFLTEDDRESISKSLRDLITNGLVIKYILYEKH